LEVQIHALTTALDGGKWSASRPSRFTPQGKKPWTHTKKLNLVHNLYTKFNQNHFIPNVVTICGRGDKCTGPKKGCEPKFWA